MTRRWQGFTLLELLIVVAIIGILSAMVFPVFTRARESVRASSCLSNVAQLTKALTIYLNDYGAFPPREHREEVLNFFSGYRCDSSQKSVQEANPYLQWPVILSKYVRNHNVWNCPQAKLSGGAEFILSNPDWLQELKANYGRWGDASELSIGPICAETYPAGWGGTVSDSIIQQQSALGAPGAFVQNIGVARHNLAERPASSFNNLSRVMTVADCTNAGTMLSIGTVAYADICCAECSGITYFTWGGWPDPNGCPDGTYCPECPPTHAMIDWAQNAYRKQLSTRHFGGSNVGFADGHVQWISARRLITLSDMRYFEGVGWYCSGGSLKWYQQVCGTPPAGMRFLHREALDEFGNPLTFGTNE